MGDLSDKMCAQEGITSRGTPGPHPISTNHMRESNLEKDIVKYAAELGMLSFKFTSPAQKGVPDRIFIHRGHVLFLEVKASKKRPTDLQMRMLRKLRDHGAACGWVNGFTGARDLLDSFHDFPETFNTRCLEIQS